MSAPPRAVHRRGVTAAASLLLGPEARALAQAALDTCGGRLRELRATTVDVHPDGSAVVQYAADLEGTGGARVRQVLAATTGARIPPGAAVLEVTGGGPRLFCKVVRPARVDALQARHDLLAAVLPTPPALAATPDGLVVLPAASGTSLRAVIDGGGALPDGHALEAVLDRLPPAVAALRRGSGDHLGRVRHFADVLALTAVTEPAARARLDDLVARLEQTEAGSHPEVPVHGDFYEGQLHADAGVVTGLLDVDTAGSGHRIDDWATLLGHLSVLGRPAARRYAAALLAHAEPRFVRHELRSRIAAAVLGLATGPYRVQHPGWPTDTAGRLALARQWLA
jgi:hypothetical protein